MVLDQGLHPGGDPGADPGKGLEVPLEEQVEQAGDRSTTQMTGAHHTSHGCRVELVYIFWTCGGRCVFWSVWIAPTVCEVDSGCMPSLLMDSLNVYSMPASSSE